MDTTELDQTHLRDVSFSSYLSMVGENFPVNLPERSPVPSKGLQTPRRIQAELGVFSAEKYYNMGVRYENDDNESRKNLRHLPTTTHVRNRQRTRFTSTPASVTSDGSSWNSQSALMLAYAKRNKASSSHVSAGNTFFSKLGCSGRSCSDKDSVIVGKPVRKSEVVGIDSKLIVFDGTKHALPRFREEPPRISLEVFGSSKVVKNPPEDDKDHVLLNMERKLSMLTWDAVPKSEATLTARTAATSASGGGGEEIESDASSDLFEIENISSRRGCGTTSSPASAYEPSEASIEWSVATASCAADIGVNGGEYDEKRVAEARRVGGGAQKSGILGCKSYTAVRVVEPAPISSYKTAMTVGGGNDKLGMRSHHHQRHHQSQVQ